MLARATIAVATKCRFLAEISARYLRNVCQVYDAPASARFFFRSSTFDVPENLVSSKQAQTCPEGVMPGCSERCLCGSLTGRGVQCGVRVPGERRRLLNRLFGFTLRFCPVCRYKEPSALSGGCRGARSPNLLVLLCVPCESSGVVFWVGVYLAGRVLVWL